MGRAKAMTTVPAAPVPPGIAAAPEVAPPAAVAEHRAVTTPGDRAAVAAIGVDAIDIARIAALRARGGERFLARVYTAAECAYCAGRQRPDESFAARYAAKEAVMKCLGTGWSEGLAFRDIEVVRDGRGAVGVALRGAAAVRAHQLGIRIVLLSLTHTATTAVAFATALR